MSVTRAVVVDPSAPERLVVRDISYPTALPSEALVRVKAISLNRGEVRTASSAEAGWRPGWDLAGIVEEGAADSSGPRGGSRGVGMLSSGSWAELPEAVSFVQAATLPTAGLTGLLVLRSGGF